MFTSLIVIITTYMFIKTSVNCTLIAYNFYLSIMQTDDKKEKSGLVQLREVNELWSWEGKDVDPGFPAWWWLFLTGEKWSLLLFDNSAWRLGVTMSFKDLSCNLSDLALNEWAQREYVLVFVTCHNHRDTLYTMRSHTSFDLSSFSPFPNPGALSRCTIWLYFFLHNLLQPSSSFPRLSPGSLSWYD